MFVGGATPILGSGDTLELGGSGERTPIWEDQCGGRWGDPNFKSISGPPPHFTLPRMGSEGLGFALGFPLTPSSPDDLGGVPGRGLHPPLGGRVLERSRGAGGRGGGG